MNTKISHAVVQSAIYDLPKIIHARDKILTSFYKIQQTPAIKQARDMAVRLYIDCPFINGLYFYSELNTSERNDLCKKLNLTHNEQSSLNELAFLFQHDHTYKICKHVAPSFQLPDMFHDPVNLIDQLLNTFTDDSLKQDILNVLPSLSAKQLSMVLVENDEFNNFQHMIQNRSFQLSDIEKKWPQIVRFAFSSVSPGRPPMQTIKIFLASSNELNHERDQIELIINRKNDALESQNVKLKLIRWEHLLHDFKDERTQNYFTKEMLACDIVLILFKKKVGIFTKEEFDIAYAHLKEHHRPRLFVFFWDGEIKMNEYSDYMPVFQLRQEIESYEQIYKTFTDPKDLENQLIHQLDLVIPEIQKDRPQIIQAPKTMTQSDENYQKLKESYLHRVLKESGIVNLTGVDPNTTGQQAESINLSAIYTALLTHNFDEKKSRQLSALNMLNRVKHLALLGDPGSGKTTFVNFVCMCLAGELLHHPQANLVLMKQPLPGQNEDNVKQEWDHHALLPLRITLRDFVAKGLPENETGSATHMWNFIQAELDRYHLSEFGPLLQNELQKNGGLVMFDGMDEVPEAKNRRKQIKEVIEDFMVAYHRCRILITARTYAYQNQDFKISGLTESTLADFSPPQISAFVDNWYNHVGELHHMHPNDINRRAGLLKHAIENKKRLQDLARRPLLLTLMASLHAWRGGSLPEQRERLYADAVDLLLRWWEQSRLVQDRHGNIIEPLPGLIACLDVDLDKIRKVLNRLAFDAHKNQPDLKGTADISEKDLVNGLLEITQNAINPGQMINFLQNRAGILIERGVGVQTFPHRTFQEYLAACYLTDTDFPDTVAKLAKTDLNRWREVLLLAAAKAGTGTDLPVWALAAELCSPDDDPSQAGSVSLTGAYLAAQALLESANLETIKPRNQQTLHCIKDSLINIMQGNVMPAIERVKAGDYLAKLGDPRESVTQIEHMAFCFVPAGPFLMGSDPEIDKKAYENETPQHQVTLSAYYLARYPVTQAQYQLFVKDGGYANPDFWEEAIADQRWKKGKFDNREDADHYGSLFDLPNHPVVGISWYEACAYARWLTHKCQAKGIISRKLAFRLPTEAEWEKASCGGLEQPDAPYIVSISEIDSSPPKIHMKAGRKRIYPWGDTSDPERLNSGQTGINSTSAVGCFYKGQSIYGCEEMSGNVWEWCYDRNASDYYKSGSGLNPTGPSSGGLRVFRGGSWDYVARYCRSARRSWDEPGISGGSLGVRLAAFQVQQGDIK